MSGLPPQAISLAVVSGAALASVGLSLLTLFRAGPGLGGPQRKSGAEGPTADAAIGVLQQKIDELEHQIEDLRRHASTSPVPLAPRAALNLDKRSQALRMHRRGESPADIAAALGIPLQEVHLLLKVHRIVLSSI
jgi:hypothetical protein